MSWKALDWATDIRVGSPTMRLILILLANKADEKFSCYPSVGTLVTESCAARSTVLETLKRLEVQGFITRVAQYHESGAQRSSRYLLNHPDAPHLKPGPDSGPPGPQVGRGGSDPWTGGVQDLDPPRVRTESATLPQSLHGASRCYPRRRVPRSGARHPGAASAKTSNPGPSPSHSRTEQRRRHSAPAAVHRSGHSRSTRR